MDKAMLTDLYELTMMAAYVDSRKDGTATFELVIRTLPEKWGYYIANGIEDAGGARMKLSPEKRSGPGKKQIFRRVGADGQYAKDIIALYDEPVSGVPLLTLAVKNGRRVRPKPALKQIRDYCLGEVAKLPNKLKGIDVPSSYPLETAPGLKALIKALIKKGGKPAGYTA